MKRISDAIFNEASFASCSLITLITLGFFVLVLIPQEATFAVSSLENSFSFEGSFGYTYDDALGFFQARRLDAVSNFQSFTIYFEGLFPLMYTCMFILWLSYLWRPAKPKMGYPHLLNFFPVIILLLDWLEHALIYTMTVTYIDEHTLLAEHVFASSQVSMAKWSAVVFVAMLLAGGLVVKWLDEGKDRSFAY